jgi:ribosomal protein L29
MADEEYVRVRREDLLKLLEEVRALKEELLGIRAQKRETLEGTY